MTPAVEDIPTLTFYGAPAKKSRLNDSTSSTNTITTIATSISKSANTTAVTAANIRPSFKSLKDNLIKFDKKLAEPIKSPKLKEITSTTTPLSSSRIGQPESTVTATTTALAPTTTAATTTTTTGEEPKSLDRDSPLPLKNLGNTCYENSIIQCLFSLNMFMDNFEKSMKEMRQYVTKPKAKTFDVYNLAEQQNQLTEDIAPNNATLTEDDVRYRISDAFDKLYSSYTRRRNQIETNKDTSAFNTNTLQSNESKPDEPDSAIISPSSEAIPLCKPKDSDQSITSGQQDDSQAPLASETNLIDETTTSNSNLTPIALISSAATSNEQSEIETRLEDLKSAVGERSSQFNSAHQQDASEFFYHVIDSIQEFYQGLNMTDDEDNPVTKAFELELEYLIRCPKCRHQTITEPEKIRTLPLALPHIKEENTLEEFPHESSSAPTPPTSDLGLDSPESNSSEGPKNGSEEKENQALSNEIPHEDNNANNTVSIAKLELSDKSEQNLAHTPQKTFTLCDALINYFKHDLLEYSCSQPGCDSKQRTKKCLIRKLPQILFITLARYSYSGKKNLDEVEAPFEIAVPLRDNRSPSHSPSAHRYLDDEDNKYQLMAVVCHLGSSLNAGHYTSYVYNQNNFSWYCCDDDSITRVQESDVKSDSTKSGYCFFYALKSCINQKPEVQRQSFVNLERLEQFGTTDTMLSIQSSVVNSSVIMTPESSPKSSPDSANSSQEITILRDDHSRCMKSGDYLMDDW